MPTTTYYTPTAIRPEDIPEECRDIAEALGMPAFLTLISLCGGQALYLPKLDSIRRQGRDRAIRAGFNGGNYRALARRYALSERQVRRIVDGPRTDSTHF